MSSKIIIWIATCLIVIVTNCLNYHYTRSNYLAVGKSVGTLEAFGDLFLKLNAAGNDQLIDCRSIDDQMVLNDFFDLKSISIKSFNEDSLIKFCIYE